MRYAYECNNEKCDMKKITIEKPMSESGRVEYCSKCKHVLSRVYSLGISTGDGFKS